MDIPEGAIPETWCCIDCGVNTAPSAPTRAALEQRMQCKHVRSDPETLATITFDERCEVYHCAPIGVGQGGHAAP